MTMGVYTITNAANGHQYVGSALNIQRRWTTHQSQLRKQSHPNEVLSRAYAKYGEANFFYEIVEIVTDKDALIATEQRWLDALKPIYNLRQRADNNAGWKPSQITLERRSAAMKRLWSDPEKRQRWIDNFVRAGTDAVKGKPLSEEHRALVSQRTKEALADPTIRAKISAAIRGKPRSDAAKKSLSAAAKKRWESPEYRAKMRAARIEDRRNPNAKRPMSDEQRVRISATKKAANQKRTDVSAKNLDPAFQARAKAGRDAYWARKRAEKAAQANAQPPSQPE